VSRAYDRQEGGGAAAERPRAAADILRRGMVRYTWDGAREEFVKE
jgi:hypothetical protein